MRRSMVLGLGLALALGSTAATTAIGAEPPKPAPSTMRQPLRQRAPTTMVVTDISLSKVFVDSQTCRLWVTWKNEGTVKIDATLRERVEVYTQPKQTKEGLNHVVLEPGQTFSHGVGAGAGVGISGATEVLAQIDVENVLNESQARRANNAIYRTVTCGRAQPDLYPSDLKFTVKTTTTDAQGHTCKVLRVKPVVLNIGTAAVQVPFKVKVEADSGTGRSWVKYHEPTVSGMAIGETLTLDGFEIDTCFWFLHNPQMLPTDVRRFKFTVDSAGNVPESQEGNNQSVKIY